jgi:SAM-dependent methyltransferase
MPTANDEQVRYWNELAGPTWVARQDLLDSLIAPLGARAIARAAVAPGERVLDVGCGCGASSLALARAVGAAGEVLGVDISAPMLARARERTAAESVANLRFLEADAQVAELGEAAFDLVFSRFGVMFFADPIQAFARLRRALRPGGRVTFVCWQPVDRNPWMLVPALAVAKHVPLPPSEPGAPGPFAFGDAERVRDLLARAGLVDVAFEEVRENLAVGGGDLDRATAFALDLGPAGAALRAADADDALRARVAGSVREALAPFDGAEGLRMPSAAWIVTARRGEDA